MNAIMMIICNWGDCQIMSFCKRTRKEIRTSDSDGSSGKYIPAVVLFPVDARPCYVGRHGISRNAPFPSVAASDVRGRREGDRGVHGGHRVVVAVVRAVLVDEVFQGERRADRRERSERALFQSLPVFERQGGGNARRRRSKEQDVARRAGFLAAACHVEALGVGAQREQEAEDEEEGLSHGVGWVRTRKVRL